MQEMRAQSLGQEDPLTMEMATYSCILIWEIRGQRNLVGYRPWGPKELDMTFATEHALLNKQRNAKWKIVTVLNVEVTMISNPCDLNMKWL